MPIALLDGKKKLITILPSPAYLNHFHNAPMTTKLTSALFVFGCLALSSCYQIQDKPRISVKPRPPVEKETVTSQDQQKIQRQRERAKERETARKEEVTEKKEVPVNEPTSTPPKPAEPKKKEYSFANPVEGKTGFVYSPYNQKVVDVRDIPSGTLVQDPTYPASEKKYFRVP